MEKELSIFDGEDEAAPGGAAEIQEQTAAEPAEAEAPEVKGEEEAAPPAAVEEKRHDPVPITALLDEREKRQAAAREAEQAKRELADLRRRIQMAEAERNQPKPPDFIENPDERLAYESQRFQTVLQQQLHQQKLSMSRFLAEREFGKEEVDAAYAYFDQHPQLSYQLLQHSSPFHAAVEFWRKQKVAEEIGGDPEGYRKKLIEELTPKLKEQLLAEIGVVPSSQPRIPGSLAAAPSTGKSEPAAFREPAALRGFFSG